MRMAMWKIALVLPALLALGACGDDEAGPTEPPPPDPLTVRIEAIKASLPTSLHGTAQGMRYWYNRPDGFGAMTGVDYEGLGCPECHVPTTAPESCETCHASMEKVGIQGQDSIKVEACLGCHGRQAAEIQMGIPDVHRAAGMQCWDCHSSQEIHGNGRPRDSFLDDPAMEVDCEGCHRKDGAAAPVALSRSHLQHNEEMTCSTCHMATSVTCLNCHFQAEIDEHKKVAAGRASGWQFLGNFRGKVTPMNFQSVEYQDHTFVAWGPFYGHSITAEGRGCRDCHATPAVWEYLRTGTIEVVRWDEAQKKLLPRRGLIPVPPDYGKALRMDFATRNADGTWRFLETGPDRMQMLYGTPLTADQVTRLSHGQ